MKKFFLFCLLSLFPFLLFAEGSRAIAVLLDISKSVPPEEFQDAKEMIQHVSDQTSAADTILIYVFGNTSRKIDVAELPTIEATESYTMLFDAAYDAAQDLEKIKADRKAILLITDGKDTKSATILEDTVSYVNKRGIAIYGIGVGKTNRKVLGRIAKLTGGKFFPLSAPELLTDLNTSIAGQMEVAGKEEPAKAQPKTVSAEPAPAPSRPEASEPQRPPEPQEETGFTASYLWIAAIGGAVILLFVVAFVIFRSTREEKRTCPTCGRQLDQYQTFCPECSVAETIQQKAKHKAGDSTQEIAASVAAPVEPQTDEDLIPVELLEKKQISEESLTKTFVLMETPMLVVRKGKNLGQSFSLNRAFPVSIGRSRVNEIQLDDVTVSGQHCRIIPENGRHVLYDLGSTNGTFVNDKKVNKAILKEGNIIKVGETQFIFKVEQHRN